MLLTNGDKEMLQPIYESLYLKKKNDEVFKIVLFEIFSVSTLCNFKT